ncbi:MAG: hypothetical protein K2P84_13825 [Undibacterium sp.]|nr:hypothetical protein [Undibacterium sp.]
MSTNEKPTRSLSKKTLSAIASKNYFLAAQHPFFAAQHPFFAAQQACFFALWCAFFAPQQAFLAPQQAFFAPQQAFLPAQQPFLAAHAFAEAGLAAHCAIAGMAAIAEAATTEALMTLFRVFLKDVDFMYFSINKYKPVAGQN